MTVLVPDELITALRTPDKFTLSAKVATLPVGIQAAVRPMADPAEDWNAGCVRSPNLPSRRLESAANSGAWWIVFYESGGFVSRQEIAVFRADPAKTELVWHTDRSGADNTLAGLAAALTANPKLAGDKSLH